ncbi:type II toxin-antitoxin system VapB family antitoxin [Terasakiella sp. SH-1]|uniref:type II toxin-antitoxin system VapB family antitoxin n=1 Tax=Terasakiella sp. SH-1 TaxID=2560057 RepID=UPI0010735924|nr:type II toxin-antitoxin system VapB family antitoxin [Terasakiella sp. SH-1]
MTQSSVFKNNQTQAVRIPKAVALPEHIKKVDVIKQGNARLIVPSDCLWDSFFDGEQPSDDFMVERSEPEMQVREEL